MTEISRREYLGLDALLATPGQAAAAARGPGCAGDF